MTLNTDEEQALCKALAGEAITDDELATLQGLGRVLFQRRRLREDLEANIALNRGKPN